MSNDKNTNLQGIMYDFDGTYMPFVGDHGNIDVEIAEQRNIFMEAEREYFTFLLSSKEIRDYVSDLLHKSTADEVFDEAMKLQDKLESGELETEEEKKLMASMTPEERDEFHLRKLMIVEGKICILLGAVRDKARVLNEIACWEDRLSRIEEATSNHIIK